jgi:hypothetical protein
LFCLLGNVWTRLLAPFDAALVLNVGNALVAALACCVLGFTVFAITERKAAGFIAGLALGTSRVFWHEALTIEVFALVALMATVLLFLEFRYLARTDERWASSWALPGCILVATTILTHHATLILIAAPALLVIFGLLPRRLARIRNRPMIRRLALRCVLAGVLGLLPLAYVPLASHADPKLNWGDVHGIDDLAALLLRKDYGSSTLQSPNNVTNVVLQEGEQSSPLKWRNYQAFWVDLPRSLGWWVLPLPLLGLVFAYRAVRPLVWQWMLFLLVLTAFFARVNTPMVPVFRAITERFYVLPHLALVFYAGLGVGFLQQRLSARRSFERLVLALLVVAAGPVALLRNGRVVDQHDNRFTRDFGFNILVGVPQDALFLSRGDLIHNSILYRQMCLRERTDVALVNQDALTQMSWYRAQQRRRGAVRTPETSESGGQGMSSLTWLDWNADVSSSGKGRPVVAVSLMDDSYQARYRLLPKSIWSQALRLHQPVDLVAWRKESERIVGAWWIESLSADYPQASWEGSEQIFYDYAHGQLLALRDIQRLSGDGAVTPVPALEVAARWRGRRAANLLAYRADLLRICSEDSTLSLSVSNRTRLVGLAFELAGSSLAIDSVNVQALQTRAAILASRSDPERELEVRRRLVALRPGDPSELVPYFRLVLNQSRHGAWPNHDRVLAEARQVHDRYRRLLDIAVQLNPAPVWREYRDHWRHSLEDIPELR